MCLIHKYNFIDIVGLSSFPVTDYLWFLLLLEPHQLEVSHSVIIKWVLDLRALMGGYISVAGLGLKQLDGGDVLQCFAEAGVRWYHTVPTDDSKNSHRH